MKKIWIISSLICLMGAGCSNKSGEETPQRRPMITSPEVHADHTVTFRFMAPNAKEVKVDPQFMEGTQLMEKDENGVWSVTVGPVEPDMYPYAFIVDGVTMMDSRNPFYFENERFKASIVDIEGSTPLAHSIQDVPHGTVNYDYYYSEVLGTTGRLLVYTPPGYDENPDQKYPVFYLISGTTDTEETYFKVGRTNFILDNLIAKGEAQPMIIVMPYGNPGAYFPVNDPRNKVDMRRDNRFDRDFNEVLMPYVEKNYRTINDRNSRGIGGFSRGGGQALRNGLKQLDKFSYVCSYASYIGDEEFRKDFKHIYLNPADTNKKLNLFWLGVGTDDFLYKEAQEYIDMLTEHGVNNVSLITGGGHTWMNAKLYLRESAKLLFRK